MNRPRDYTPAIFSRDNPCTKVEIHNCFFRDGSYRPRSMIEAKTIIGDNVPKYLIREDLVRVRIINNVDMYCPTAKGDNWMRTGIAKFLANHPERAPDLLEPPAGYALKPAKKTRQGASKAPVEAPVIQRRFLARRRPQTV